MDINTVFGFSMFNMIIHQIVVGLLLEGAAKQPGSSVKNLLKFSLILREDLS